MTSLTTTNDDLLVDLLVENSALKKKMALANKQLDKHLKAQRAYGERIRNLEEKVVLLIKELGHRVKVQQAQDGRLASLETQDHGSLI